MIKSKDYWNVSLIAYYLKKKKKKNNQTNKH